MKFLTNISVNNDKFTVDATNGNTVTLGTITWSGGSSANANAAYTHISSTGADHSYINQSVTTTASPTFAGITVTGLTASRALITDASSNLVVSTVTSTELGYVSGVTSAIQTQLNGKAPTNHASTATTYGVGDTTNYGHVKISDGIVSTSGVISIDVGDGVTLSGTTPNKKLIANVDGTSIVLTGTSPAKLISHGDTSSIATLTASARTYVTGLTFDTYGHVTALTTASETVVDTNNYLTGVSGTCGGTITFTRSGLSNLTWDSSHTHAYSSLTSIPTTFNPSPHASTHLPSGADPLTTAAPGTISPNDTVLLGTANSFARSDHRHSITTASAVSLSNVTTNTEGNATSFARSNHTHQITGFLTSYTETDTLASVTGRGATTSTASTFNGGLTTSGITDSGTLSVTGNATFSSKIGVATTSPQYGLDLNDDMRVRTGKEIKFGGTGAADEEASILYNSTTKSISFRFVG